ncbi:MAG: GNAT family N-acetyltransferase [Candidatus Marinimicrobia bacterium]|jgi:hypothetical protein|nr:GNAT family N-acetyltransferase [Candidatus Neomarinimicrobiota bacterium]
MSIIARPFEKKYTESWENLVGESVNGTIFHTRKFLSYHPTGRFTDASLMFAKGDDIFALFPAVRGVWNDVDTLWSHRGASYGGFVHREGLGISTAFELVESLVDHAKKEGARRIVITLPPVIYNHRLSNYLDFAMVKNGFTYLKREVSSVVYLENDIEKNVAKFKQTNRTAFRRAMKLGVDVRESDDFATFYEILKKNLKIRHGVQPTHTLEELVLLKKLFPDKIFLYAAYAGNEMVAGVVMFDCNPDVSLAFYISHNEARQEFRGVNILFYHIINRCIQKGFHWLDFGIFTVNMDPNFGLAHFKEGFGSSGILRDSLSIDL